MKRNLYRLALYLLIAGIIVLLAVLFQGVFIQADAVSYTVTESNTLASFLWFGGSMIGSAIILFIILAHIA